MSIEKANVAILVFAMPGCPACHEYLPRLYRQIEGFQKLGHPILVYEGQAVERGTIPVVVIDSTSQEPSVQSLCDKHKIHALPTTVLLPKYGMPMRWEGALPDQDVYNLLNGALGANR